LNGQKPTTIAQFCPKAATVAYVDSFAGSYGPPHPLPPSEARRHFADSFI
jgi:hypothetical protein